MPRDPSGNYEQVELDVKSQTTIRTEWANNTVHDFSAEITDSLSRSGKGGMQDSLALATKDGQGTGVLGQSWVDEPTTGAYLQSAGVVVQQVQGNDVLRWTVNGLEEYRDGAWQTISSQIAAEVPFDPSSSGLTETNVQGAIDELYTQVDDGYVSFDEAETITGQKTFTAETKFTNNIQMTASADKLIGADRNSLIFQEPNGDTTVGNFGGQTILDTHMNEGVYHRWGAGGSDFGRALNEKNFLAVMQETITDAIFPVGAVHLTADNVNPGGYLAGTWERISEPGYLGNVGTAPNNDLGNNEYNIAPGFTNGYIAVNITKDQLPAHDHDYDVSGGYSDTGGGAQRHPKAQGSGSETFTTRVSGGNGEVSGDDLPTYPPVLGNYVWVRTA